jgi:Mrp family chromosome partitioning ATPase
VARRRRHANKEIPQSEVDACVASGGLAIVGREGLLLHMAPPDVANSLRFFLSRLWQSGDVGLPPTIAISSAIEGEGVTFVARSLAAVMAHDLDRSICLLETNWWSAPDSTAVDRRTGLADVLRGQCTVDQALVHTSDDRLVMLTSGDIPVAARPAMVASSAFADVLKLLTKVFDAVVIDAPPVLKASEATSIVRHAEAAVLVVRQGVTTERQLGTAIDELSGIELGLILNRCSTRIPKPLRRFSVPA